MRGIDEILNEILSRRKAYELVNVPKNTWFNWKKKQQVGKLSHEKKGEILDLFGYRKVQQEQWTQI